MSSLSRGDRGGLYREVPAGLGDLLPEAAARCHAVRAAILGVMARWGYRPVVPPLLEYAEAFTRALSSPAEEASLYTLVDRATGHALAIRSDFTPQVARLVAGRFQDATLPLRLCYEGSALRHVPAQRGRSRELHQAGAELLGVQDPEADAEAIALTVACLTEAGVGEFKVDVGQVEFYKGILLGTDLSPEDQDALTSAVARKDGSDLSRLLGDLPIPDAKKHLLAELPLLAGGVEVIGRAEALVESDHSRAALANLARVVDFVDAHGLAHHLTVDLGKIRGVDYHTGVIFEAFVHHLGVPLCRGGRYDRLLERYGRSLPATGFSLDLLALMEALHLAAPGAPGAAPRGVFVVNFRPQRGDALALAQALRAAGVRSARDLIRRPLEDSLTHARAEGFRWAAVLRPAAGSACVLVDLAAGSEEALTPAELVRRVAEEN